MSKKCVGSMKSVASIIRTCASWKKAKMAMVIDEGHNAKPLNSASKANITRKHVDIDRRAAALKAWVTRRAIAAAK